jgi:hypothetical protein
LGVGFTYALVFGVSKHKWHKLALANVQIWALLEGLRC